jgi:adenylate kinase
MNLIFLGPPGAGKGTQAQRICAAEGWPHISTGDLLRAARASGSELGQKARAFMDAGALVPDALICEVVGERLRRPDCRRGWILDGFPRTRVQADMLLATLADLAMKLHRCVHFHMDEQALVQRLVGRWTCKNCGAPYHEKFKKPAVQGVCDVCGGALYQRPDDVEATVMKRLNEYKSQTQELVPYFEKRGLLTTIDASGTPEEVSARLEPFLSEK